MTEVNFLNTIGGITNLDVVNEGAVLPADSIIVYDTSAGLFKVMTIEDLQDEIDTTGSAGFSASDITGATDLGNNVASADSIVIHDATASALREMTIANLTSYFNSASILTNLANTDTNTNQLTTFTLTADSGTNQTIAHSNTLDIAGGNAITTVVSATDTVTINHDDTSTQASVNNSGRTYIQDITLDGYGHITGIASATETVTDSGNDNTTYDLLVPASTTAIRLDPSSGDDDDITLTGGTGVTVTRNSATQLTFSSDGEANVATNLAVSANGTSLTITSSTGDNASLPLADTNNWGVMSDELFDKLDGIEASATADQTNAEIRTAVEAASDSNVFTDDDHTKLNGIEASADVTDTANVTAAGALMDSELTDLAGVKGVTISTLQVKPSEGAFVNGDKTKLDAIETSATADQTAAEIRTLVESASDSNVFTDDDHTKLNGIAASANNYTHTTNANLTGDVTSSGNATTIADDAVTTDMIADDAVTEDKLANTLLAEIDANTDKVTNVSTNLSVTANGTSLTINSSDGDNVSIPAATSSAWGIMTDDLVTAIGLNTAKNTNVSTNLGITGTTAARTITSSDGDNVVIPVATTSVSGVMSKATFDAVVLNTAKATDVNHNVSTNLSATANGTSLTVESSDGNNVALPAATTNAWGVMTDEMFDAVAANTLKNTNVSTDLGKSVSGTGFTITSSDGDNVALSLADTDNWGLMSDEMFDKLAGITAGATDNVGTVTSVTAGTGMTQSGTSTVNPTLNVIGGNGITANANDVAITAAQTTITSVLNTGLVIGRDATDQIKFSTDNQIIFRVDGADNVKFKTGGEIEATKFDGALEGNADTATAAATLNIRPNDALSAGTYTDENNLIPFIAEGDSGIAAGSHALESADEFHYNPHTKILTVEKIASGLTGDVTGNISGNAGGSSATVTSIGNLTGDVTSSNRATTIAANSVTLAKMAGITRGSIIIGDSSGDPAELTVGDADYVLTSDGTDISWAEVSSGGDGDITGVTVTAGTGMTGGGTDNSGAVSLTLNVIGGTGITANANDIAIDSTVVTKTGAQTLTNKTIAASQVTEISNLTAVEGAQLENIGSVTISNAQWGYLGAATGAITNTDTVYALTDDLASGEITQLQNIGSTTITATQWGYLGASSGAITNTDTNTNQLTTFTLTGDSGTNQTIAHGNTLDVAGGTGIDTVVGNTDTVTVAIDNTVATLSGSQTLSNKTIAVSQVTELSNLTANEGAQLENIGSTTISATQWGYLGAASGAITNTDTNTQNEYATSFVDSSNDVLLRLTESGAGSGTQDIKFVAGTNITLTPSGTNMTIAASGGGSSTDSFMIFGEESDDYLSSTSGAGNANGWSFAYGNGAHNTTKSSSGVDFGLPLGCDCTLKALYIHFGNKNSRTGSSNMSWDIFKNQSGVNDTMTGNASGSGGNSYIMSKTNYDVDFDEGDTFNVRIESPSGYNTSTQVGPARMVAYFERR